MRLKMGSKAGRSGTEQRNQAYFLSKMRIFVVFALYEITAKMS